MKTAAIIGCGRPPQNLAGQKIGWGIANAHAEGYRKAFPGAALYAVDPNPENLTAFADKHGLPRGNCFSTTRELYAALTPDAVSTCTWPALHVPQAIEACSAGVRALVVEKPLGLDSFEIQTLLDTAIAKDARIAVAHQRRYEPAFIEARNVLRSGELGDKLVLQARVGDDWDMLSWTVHWFDMANFLFESQPVSVLAGVHHSGQRRYGHAVEDASVVFVEYDRPGRQALFVTGPAEVPQGGIVVNGDSGMLSIGQNLRLWTTKGYREINPAPYGLQHAFAELIADLWASVGTAHLSECDIRRCAVATQTAYAAHESAVTQQRVTLPSKRLYPALEVSQHAPALPAPRSLRVALLADGHHEYPGMAMSGRDGLFDALTDLGHRVTLLDAARELADDALSASDLLVLYHTQRKASESHRTVLGAWFNAGKPVVISHCGIGAYADWPEFRRWIGCYWVWGDEPGTPSRHPLVSCELHVDDASFEVPWAQAWLPIDEMYQQLGSAAPIKPLLTARAADGEAQCYAWQVTESPNVVAWLPGHRRDIFSLPIVRDGLAAAIRLAVRSARQ